MTKVRAKMRCSMVQHTEVGHTVRVEPVTSGSEENDQFYRYTPSGHVELSVVSQETADLFRVGEEYYVDFTPAK